MPVHHPNAIICRLLVAVVLLSTSVFVSAQFVGNNPQAVEKRVDDLLAKMTLEEKLISSAVILRSGPIPFPGLTSPSSRWPTALSGHTSPAPTIAYAAGIGLAASWDTELALHIGQQLGRDSRSRGAAFLLGPGVNIYRAPMNGRNFEYFGEDPFLASGIAVGYIRGVQQEGVSAAPSWTPTTSQTART
jgi:beta-glucosidase